jgi:hypothetical protein
LAVTIFFINQYLLYLGGYSSSQCVTKLKYSIRDKLCIQIMHTIFFVRTTMQVSIYCSYNEISYLGIIWVFYCFLVAFSAVSFFSDFRMYFCSYVCVLPHLCCMGYCLSVLMWFYLFVKTFITEFVLVPLFSVATDADSNSASTASTSFQWLSLFPSVGLDMFALIYAFLASVTTLCGLLRGPDHLFDLFSYLL